MKEKLVSLFSGKALYISIASILVCAVAVSGSVIAVKVNNNKLDKALESLSNVITEGTTEVTTEATTEMASESLTVTTITPQDVGQVKSEYGDKGIAYLKEYDKLTETYKAKRAELEGELVLTPVKGFAPTRIVDPGREPTTRARTQYETDEMYEEYLEIFNKHYADWSIRNSEYESLSVIEESQRAQGESKKVARNQHHESVKKQIADLDGQYQKDVNSLKVKYGIK